jgi:formate-nitrite transporter family protein
VTTSPTPEDIYARRQEEGRRRLSAPLPAQASAAFTAGFVVSFGIVASAAAAALVSARFGTEAGELVGALAFGVGLLLLVVARAELLFTENLLDPVIALRRPILTDVGRLLRLWAVALVVNAVGGALLLLVLTASDVIPQDAQHELARVAEEIAARDTTATFLNGIAGGALVTLLSWLVGGADTVGGRALMAWLVGVLLIVMTLGHAVVTLLQLFAGMETGANLTWGDVAGVAAVTTAGNLVGGFGFVTTTQVARVKARDPGM